ncbi:MAG: iron transporter [Alphaproteobacteria bacterium]|nr:iron transporter [Alphaproteobacteria bacterium]
MSQPGHHHHHHPHYHHEHHVKSSDFIKDLVLGMADGLTVPFALAAGLSGVAAGTGIIVTAGVAEIAAGTIAMGLGGYLAAKTQAEHYRAEYAREVREVKEVPHVEAAEVAEIIESLGVPKPEVPIVVKAISADPKRWVDFMMKMELGLEKPDPGRIVKSPLTIGAAYTAGGMIPLFPYMLLEQAEPALVLSALVTLVALFLFGALKGRFTGVDIRRSAWQTTAIGAAAAATAYGIAKLIG